MKTILTYLAILDVKNLLFNPSKIIQSEDK